MNFLTASLPRSTRMEDFLLLKKITLFNVFILFYFFAKDEKYDLNIIIN